MLERFSQTAICGGVREQHAPVANDAVLLYEVLQTTQSRVSDATTRRILWSTTHYKSYHISKRSDVTLV